MFLRALAQRVTTFIDKVKPWVFSLRRMGETSRKMEKSNRSVAVRTLIMAAILLMGLVATMFAKGLISTTVLTS